MTPDAAGETGPGRAFAPIPSGRAPPQTGGGFREGGSPHRTQDEPRHGLGAGVHTERVSEAMPESVRYKVRITNEVDVSTSHGPGEAARIAREAAIAQQKVTRNDPAGNLAYTSWPVERDIHVERVTP